MNAEEDTAAIEDECELKFVGFALTDCNVQVSVEAVKYLRAVHSTALELAIHNHFGFEIGGFWLTTDQVTQLKSLCEYYPPGERTSVNETIEAYLLAQLKSVDTNFLRAVLKFN